MLASETIDQFTKTIDVATAYSDVLSDKIDVQIMRICMLENDYRRNISVETRMEIQEEMEKAREKISETISISIKVNKFISRMQSDLIAFIGSRAEGCTE